MIGALLAGARLFAGRAVKRIGGALGWLLADARRWLTALVIIAALAGWWQFRRAQAWESAFVAERAARAEDNRRWRAAADLARARAIANRDAVEAQWRDQYQEAINENDRLRRDYRGNLSGWLRERAPGGGAPRGADLPATAALPGGAVHDAAAADVPAAAIVDGVPVSDLERCADAFAQLAALIGFVTAAQAVETSPGDAPGDGD